MRSGEMAFLFVVALAGSAFAQSADIGSAKQALLGGLASRLTTDAIAQATGATGNFPSAIRTGAIRRAETCLANVPNQPPYSDAIATAVANPESDYLTPLRHFQIHADAGQQSIRSTGWTHIACLEIFSSDVRTVVGRYFDGSAATTKRAYRAYAQQHQQEAWPWRALMALAAQNPSPDASTEAIEAGQRYLLLASSDLDRAEANAALAALFIRLDERESAGRHAEAARTLAEQALVRNAHQAEWKRLVTYAYLSLSTNSWNSALASAEQDAQRAITAAETYASAVGDLESQCLVYRAYFNMAGVLRAGERAESFMSRSNIVARQSGFYGNQQRCPTVVMLSGDRNTGQQLDLTR